MKDNPSVSILVPVYKVEQYLARCIESVLAQDFTDWELVLVDDGSPDRCPEICDEYAQKDRRIRVVHKENGGVHSARLAGFEEAQGEYLIFLDSDDWLTPNALRTLYNHATDGNYDIVRGCNIRVDENGQYNIERGRFYKGEVYGPEEYLLKVIRAEFETYIWGAIYRRDLFDTRILRIISETPIGEDWLTNIAIGENVQKTLCVEDVVYNYFINTQGAMQSQICSFEYADRVKYILEQLTAKASTKVKHWVRCNRMAAYINCLFVPELQFNWKHYRDVRKYIENKANEDDVRSLLDVKFMKFIHVPALFFLYSRLYCFLFKYIKLKGNKRKVLI